MIQGSARTDPTTKEKGLGGFSRGLFVLGPHPLPSSCKPTRPTLKRDYVVAGTSMSPGSSDGARVVAVLTLCLVLLSCPNSLDAKLLCIIGRDSPRYVADATLRGQTHSATYA